MTETEWLTITSPRRMLEHLAAWVTDRKMRLFGVACCRSIGHLLAHDLLATAVSVAEALADGDVSAGEADLAYLAAAEVDGEQLPGVPPAVGYHAARAAVNLLPPGDLIRVWEDVALAAEGDALARQGAPPEVFDAWAEQTAESGRPLGWVTADAEGRVADILRCHFNPFRTVARGGPWVTPAAVTVARDCYHRRDFSTLPLLADLLEEAGCPEQRVLDHCRSGDEHARGCWAVDLVLGKG